MSERILLLPATNDLRGRLLDQLGDICLEQWEASQIVHYLHQSIYLYRDAIRDDPGNATYLGDLGWVLRNRFEQLGDLNDLNESISKLKDAVHQIPDAHPDKPVSLNKLGVALQSRFERLGGLTDLKEGISKLEDAVHLIPDGHPNKPIGLSNLGTFLRLRFEYLGDLRDLNESISMLEDAVDLTQDGHPDKHDRLTNLGTSLQTRFERLGDLSDLNESISKLEDAVHLVPNGYPTKTSSLNNLGISLQTRFQRLGDIGDLNEAISKLEDAVHLTPDGRPDKPGQLVNLGISLRTRFERLGDLSDLNESITRLKDAVHLTPDDHPHKPISLSHLGNSLRDRFGLHGDLSDANEGISKLKDAIHLTPDGSPDKPRILNNLGTFLRYRFEQLGDLSDINDSISKLKDGVHLTPDGHPDKAGWLSNLGGSLIRRLEQIGDLNDLQQTIFCFKASACSITGPPHVRLYSAKLWAVCAEKNHHQSLLEAYQVALHLLPEVAWLGLSINDRHYQIMQIGSLVRDAAAAAILSGQPEKAVEWLEQGRGIIWGQFLNLRTPVDALKEKWPELANELISLSAEIEAATSGKSDAPFIISEAQPNLSSIAQQAHKTVQKRAVLLEKIRQLEGFQQFLLPKTFSQLLTAAQKGPVVFLNVSTTSCDGLILREGPDNKATHVPFPELTSGIVKKLTQSFQNMMSNVQHGKIDRLYGRREGRTTDLEGEFLQILSDLWLRLAKPVLHALGITVNNLPHIWWCPTGPLTSLPIHAAGLYGENVPFGSKLSDFVISSYTPSLAALMQPMSQSQQEFQLLAVAQASAMGQSYLPGTTDEINQIQECARDKVAVCPLMDQKATVARVEEGMMKSTWVHFACHGLQDRRTPTESALLLAGSSRLTLERIIRLSLPHANFAFLSACQTATGDKELQDESVHLAAGMLLAGYRGVIATMWSIMDNDAPQVAADVYKHLFKTSPPDSTQAAEALHLAIRNLQEGSEGGKSLFRWVPFIHVGI
ncbi:CHAT domain-containing protein [Mycena pura]|uniref:CHAT domain-containing protein n=1 Tax=Mycena pura TaxID=153505 RepID=A0AAD6Y533_9AGAR|nr:CHAT domain-containing protein [Mycena pura]